MEYHKSIINVKFVRLITLQYAIVVLIPIGTAILLNSNNYLNLFEEFVGYSCGITGLFVTYAIRNFSIAGTAYLVFKYFIIYAIFSYFEKSGTKKKKIIIASIVNLVLAIWAALFGAFWMFASMQ